MDSIYVKRNGKLKMIGEGDVFRKKDVALISELTASLGQNPSVQQAVAQAKRVMNQNPNVKNVSGDLGKQDNSSDENTGEGMEVHVPADASAQQISNVQKMASNQSMDDASLVVDKPNTGSNNTSESVYRNAIPFSKREMNELLESIMRG